MTYLYFFVFCSVFHILYLLKLKKKYIYIFRGECTETCKARRRDLEAESKQLRRELKTKDDRCLAAEREVQVNQVIFYVPRAERAYLKPRGIFRLLSQSC